ncbi:uncharacterized protein LOC107470151 [Arachis duranensis]|uniref:Uncharacterized protein LOC107470151 n=1 Tax=Arachis duranensis TaxID=130453 RepID=A0A6P4BN96_ARADU|nr:uncharacterized protein LOC107470151 [Arachis duranensis]
MTDDQNEDGHTASEFEQEQQDAVNNDKEIISHGANFHVAPLEELISITYPWPFAKWGLDLLGPFPKCLDKYGIPNSITTDNGTQFTDSTFRNLVASMKIKHQFTSVGHPQANGQAEAANKIILDGLKKRLQDIKGSLGRGAPSSVMGISDYTPVWGETPFRLTYGIEAMVPVKVNEQSPRVRFYDEIGNIQAHKEELKLLPKV